MGIFSGLLSGLLGGGGGGIGDIINKAVSIGNKIVNRKEGESIGSALMGQLPAIASGLGGLAKNFGGFIPGVGGIVSKIGEAVEDGAKAFEQPEEEQEVDNRDDNYVNSSKQLMKHASNNMPVMAGLPNVHRQMEPARMSRTDMDFPTNSRGNSSNNWRKFKPSQIDKIDQLQEMNENNMYATHLPSVRHKSSIKPQTIEDVQPIKFKKNFLR